MKNNRKFLSLILVFVFISLTLVLAAESDEVKLIGITLEFNNTITLGEVYVSPINGFPTEDQENPDYELRLLDSKENILTTLKLSQPVIVFSADPSWFDEETGEQIVIPDFSDVVIKETYFLQYSNNIKYVSLVDLTDNREEIFREDINHYVILNTEDSVKNYLILLGILFLVFIIIWVLKKGRSFLRPKPIRRNKN